MYFYVSFKWQNMFLLTWFNCSLISGLSLIDDGKNPDEFTRDIINNCIAKNQITKGKTDALKVDYDSWFLFDKHALFVHILLSSRIFSELL